MTGPGNGGYDFGVSDELATRVRQTLGASVHLVTHPGLAAALSQANPTAAQINAVGKFVDGLELAKQVRLARQGGAALNLSDDDRALLGAVNENFQDVDVEYQQHLRRAQAASGLGEQGPHGFLGHLAAIANSTGSVLFDNPVVRPIAHGLNRAADIAKTPYRLASTIGLDFSVYNPFTGKYHGLSDDTLNRTGEQFANAQAAGYDTNNSSMLAYFSRGEQVYKSMNDLRDKYGSANVDVARSYVTARANGTLDKFLDPEADPDTLAQRIQATNDDRFQELVSEVDARHASPGRDLARNLDLRPGTHPFGLVSGATDGLVTWYADPLLIAGKAYAGYKANKLALDSMADTNGVRKIMYGNAAVRRGWTAFLDDSKLIRSGDEAESAAALARIRARTPDLVPLVDEVNGVRVATRIDYGKTVALRDTGQSAALSLPDHAHVSNVKPIETYDELVDHVTGTAALTRLNNGMAASQAVFMPGSVSRYGFRQMRALAAGKLTENGVRKAGLDYSKTPWRYIPVPGDAIDQTGKAVALPGEAGANTAARSTAAERGFVEDNANSLASNGRMYEKVSRRLTSLLPTSTAVAYDSPQATEQLRRFALTYMPKAQADVFAAAFSRSNIANRRAIYKSVVEQLIHSAGMESTASGKKLAEAMRSDLSAVDKQRYSTIGLDKLTDDAGTRNVGLWPGQMNNEMWLPSFSEMQKAAAKAGVWDHTIGSVLNTTMADKVFSTIRTGWLVTGAGALRNSMDELGAFLARGQGYHTFLQARGTLSAAVGRRIMDRELPNAREQLAEAKATLSKAPYKGMKDAQAAVKDAAQLVRHLKVRSWFYRGAGVGTNAVAKAYPLKGLSRAEMEQYAAELSDSVGRTHLDALDGIGHKMPHSTVTADGLEEAQAIAAAGIAPKSFGFRLDGWDSVSTDGEAGARAWSHNLDQRFTDDGLGWATLRLLRSDNNPALRHVIAETTRRHADLGEFRDSAEMLRFLHQPTLPAEVAAARMNEYIDRLSADMHSVVSDRNGNPIEPLVNYLHEHGKAPSIDWIERNVPNALRPEHAVGRKWVAVPPANTRVGGLAQGYSNFLSRAYDLVVNKPISYMSRHPIYAANYALARKNLAAYEKALVDHGIEADRASALTKDLAHQHAWDKTVSIIDDPEIQTHFSVLSRNFVNFYRAQEQFVRRWATVIKEDPTRVRKAQLAFQAGVHSGMIDHDENGVPTFVYPGSGAAITAVIRAANVLSGANLAQIPAVPNLTSKVMFLNPSLDNPLQISFSPIVSVPFHTLQHFFPDHALGFSQVDTVLNGQQGAGRPWWQYFVPTPVNRFMQALSGDDRRSQVASAARNAIVNLDAAGKLPGPNATPDEVDQFIQRIQAGAKNQLFVRSLFAFFLPASPSLPEETTGDATKADPAFQAQGLRTMKQEFRSLVNDLGYQKALAVWTKVHPDDLAYTVGTTDSGGAFVPPTEDALKYMQAHLDLFKKYPSIAAFFLPDAPGAFSPPAWNAELAQGLRTYKGLDQFYGDVRVVTAEREYYAAQDRRDEALAQANAEGNKDLVRQIKQGWSDWSTPFMALNPLFAQKLSGYAVSSRQREAGLAELKGLVQSGEITQFGSQAGPVLQLLDAYTRHNEFVDFMRNRSDKTSDAQKSAEAAAYAAHQQQIVSDHPELKDTWNGLFRAPGDPRIQ